MSDEPLRTFSVDYLGEGIASDAGDLFDEVVEVFERNGFKVEGGSDGPTKDNDDCADPWACCVHDPRDDFRPKESPPPASRKETP